MIGSNISPELQKWFNIAHTLGIDESLIDNFLINFSEDGGFATFRADAPNAASVLSQLDDQALCICIVNLTGEQQAWLKARLEEAIKAGQTIGSRLNQVSPIIYLPNELDGHLARFAREQQAQAEQHAREMQAQATLQRENAQAKELLLELLTTRFNDQERVEAATALINAALLSLTTEQEKSTWLTEKTALLCQEQTHLFCQSLGIDLNQAECLAAVNNKITSRLPEEQQQMARDCLTVTVAAKPAAEQLAYLSSISSNEAAFAELLALLPQRARQMQNFERQIVHVLRFAHKITDPQVINNFKTAIQQAFPLDITRQQTLFNEYETTAKADFSLQGFQQFLESKKPQPVVAAKPVAAPNTTARSTSSSSSSSSAVMTPAFNSQKQAAKKSTKRKKEEAEQSTSTRQLRPRKNGNTPKQ